MLCLREQNTTRKNENRDPPQRLGQQPAKRQSVGRRVSDSTGQTLKGRTAPRTHSERATVSIVRSRQDTER